MKKDKKDKKSILKKIGLWAGTIAVSVGIGAGIGSGVAYSLADEGYSSDYYAEDKQIEYFLKELDCDSSYLKSKNGDIYRLAHNDGDPIQVSFEEDYDERLKKIAIQSLDYMFGLVQDINPLYTYKLVTLDEFRKKGRGVNGIKFGIRPQDEMISLSAQAQANTESISKGPNRIVDCEVWIADEKRSQMSDKNVYYSFIHELMHLFGSKDVYINDEVNPTNTKYSNTIMRTLNDDDVYFHQHLSPNDYDNILAIYSPRCETQEEMEKMLKVCKEKSNDYRENYYKEFAQEFKSKEKYAGLKYQDCTKVDSLKISCRYLYKGEPYVSIDIEINGDEYKFQCSSDKGEYQNKVECVGKVVKYADCIVFRKMEMDRCYWYPENHYPYKGEYVLFSIDTRSPYSVIMTDMYMEDFGKYLLNWIKKTKEVEATSQSIISKRINKDIKSTEVNFELSEEDELIK